MLTFKYTARNPNTGEKVHSEVQADSEQAASKLIRDLNLAPIDISAITSDQNDSLIGRLRSRVKTKEKIIFSRQLSTLINAGLPLVQSLRNVASQTQNKTFRLVINEVITDVEGGSTLANSMSKHPHVFNEVFVNLVAAGETSGTLDKALERIADQQEKDAEIISKVRGALIYPAVVLTVMIGVVIFMVVKVLPAVEEVYKDFDDVALPLVTKILLVISHFFISFWWAVIIFIAVAIFFTSRWARTGPGKEVVDKLKMRAPMIGPLFMKMYMARFARTGATLVSSGVPLIQMLNITANSMNNIHMARSINRAIEKVKGGKALSESIQDDPNFLELVPNMLRVGEQSGSIEEMFSKTADYFEREVDNQVKAISTIIEPVLMIVIGVMALIVVAAVLLPIYSLAGKAFST